MARKKSTGSFQHDWSTMVLALAAAGLALYIGLMATTQTNLPQVAGDSTSSYSR